MNTLLAAEIHPAFTADGWYVINTKLPELFGEREVTTFFVVRDGILCGTHIEGGDVGVEYEDGSIDKMLDRAEVVDLHDMVGAAIVLSDPACKITKVR